MSFLSTVKVERTKDYFVANNHILKNKSVNLKLRGLLMTILSLPEDWDFTIKGLTSILPEGQTCIYRQVRELIALGYCKRSTTRGKNGHILSVDYVFYEVPYTTEVPIDQVEDMEEGDDSPVLDYPLEDSAHYKYNNPKDINYKDVSSKHPNPYNPTDCMDETPQTQFSDPLLKENEVPSDDILLNMLNYVNNLGYDVNLLESDPVFETIEEDEKVVSTVSQDISFSLKEKVDKPKKKHLTDADKQRRKIRAANRKKGLFVSQQGQTPIPEDWLPQQEEIDLAKEKLGRDLDIDRETRKFRDHYLAKGYENKNWTAMWRNWLRRALDFKQNSPPGKRQITDDYRPGTMQYEIDHRYDYL